MKTRIEELAIHGGTPAFTRSLHVGAPNVAGKERFLELVGRVLDRRWLTNGGPLVQDLENCLAERLGVKHCVAMCNGTVALEITMRALELTGEVIVPGMTFIATVHALQWLGITPVFCDIDPQTHNLDPRQVEKLITPRTSGILGVHLWGRPCAVDSLAEIAAHYNLALFYDAAHALGCSHQGRMLGNFGQAEVFSFHATKFFNTLEGGAVTTNLDSLAAGLRLMRNFGFSDYDTVVSLGINGKMNEVSAAMGLASLEYWEAVVEHNRRLYRLYQQELDGLAGLHFTRYAEDEKNNFQYIVLEIDADTAGLTRDRLLEILWAENVLARRYFYPGCHRMEPYRSLPRYQDIALPETERLVQRTLLLPNGTAVSQADAAEICQIIRLALRSM